MSRHSLAKTLGVDVADVGALMALCAVEHKRMGDGMIAGMCVCGWHAKQPIPPACRALGRLVERATAERVLPAEGEPVESYEGAPWTR